MISILLNIILLLVILGLVWWLIDFLPLPAPLKQIITVLFVLIAILLVLSVFGIVPGLRAPKFF